MTTDRNHPVRVLLDGCTLGQTPTAEDWDQLAALTPGQRLVVQNAARDILEAKAAGRNADARDIAADTAERIAANVDPITQPESGDRPDPAALAAAIRRGF